MDAQSPMNRIRQLAQSVRTLALGGPPDPVDTLRQSNVPFTPLESCLACADPCDDAYLGEFPKFDVDRESQMLGSTKPYGRQVVISTGAIDWPREVTDVSGSLAAELNDAHNTLLKASKKSKGPVPHSSDTARTPTPQPEKKGDKKEEKKEEAWPGLFDTSASTRLSITNGSHRSISEDHTRHTIIILPDYKFTNDVSATSASAKALWASSIDPSLGRAGLDRNLSTHQESAEFKTWPLPYDSVILLCSHKRRDNRCSIAAPILENALTTLLHARGWEVHTQIDDSITDFPGITPYEDIPGSTEEREAAVLKQLKGPLHDHDEKRALVLKISHIGGHKFAGNVIVYTPTGAAIWYGRVSPKEITAVVDETIIGGRVIPELLRAGVNVSQTPSDSPPRQSVYDW